MTRKNAQIVLVAAALMGVAGVAAGQETEELVRTIPMEPGGRLTLRNVEGGITVTGVDGDDLTIRATKRASRRGGDDDALARVEISDDEGGTATGEVIPGAPQGLPSLPGLSPPEPPMPPPPPPVPGPQSRPTSGAALSGAR